MKTEFEVQFLGVDRENLKQHLSLLGANCIMENTLMKRVVFENPLNKEKSYLRVRDEGKKITCTYKELVGEKLDINSKKELEVEVSNFDEMVSIFRKVGLRQKAYQESYRETWAIGEDIFFMLDEWPGLRPFLEIEAKNEDLVRQYSDKLGFSFEDGFFGAVDELYFSETGISKEYFNNLEIITFENPPKKI